MILINEETIQSKIYIVRGQKEMLDVDLAEIYGYETKGFNRQVKNNQQKFEGDDFMFQLTDEEVDGLLRCKNCTLNRGSGRGKHVKYNPYVFAEHTRDINAIKSSLNTIDNEVAEVVDRLGNIVTKSELSGFMNIFGEPEVYLPET